MQTKHTAENTEASAVRDARLDQYFNYRLEMLPKLIKHAKEVKDDLEAFRLQERLDCLQGVILALENFNFYRRNKND
jgi:hypothetical protein